MKRVLKLAGIILVVLAGLLILTVFIVNIIPDEKYKSLIYSGVQSATGRKLAIEGDLDISLFTSLAFNASGIKFSNAEWGSQPHMASIERVEGELGLIPLLSGILDVTLLVDNPDLYLETHSSGRGNWQFGELVEEVDQAIITAKKEAEAEEETKSGGGFAPHLRIRKLQLNGTRITFLDGKSGDQIELHSEKLHEKSSEEELFLELKGKFKNMPLALSGGFDNAEFFIDNQPADMQFNGYLGDVKLMVQGTAGPLMPNFDIDATLTVDSDSVTAFSPLIGRELPDFGPLSGSVKLFGKKGEYAVSELLATVDDENLSARIKGSIADLAALTGLKLEAKVNTGQLNEILKTFGIQSKYPLPDTLNAAVVAEGSLKNLAVKEFQTKIQGRGLSINGTAEAKNIMTLEGVSADVTLETESLDIVADITKTKLPPIGPLKVNADIVSKGEKLSVLAIKADLSSEIIRADLAGTVEDLLKMKGVNANFNLDVDSLAWLADYVKSELPPMGSLNASANITSKGDTFALKDLKADLTGEKIQANVTGSMGDLLNAKQINAKVRLGIANLAVLSDIIKTELPPLGPLNLSAGIASKGETIEIKDLKADLADEKIKATVAASVKDVLQLVGINADINIAVDSLASLNPLLKQTLPVSDPVTLAGKISSIGGAGAPTKITTVIKSDGVTAKLAGSIAEPLVVKGIDLELLLKADSMQKVGKLTGIQFQGQESVKLEGQLTNGENSYELAALHLQIGELDIKGQAALKQPVTPDGRPQFTGELHVGELDLSKGKGSADSSAETEPSSESDTEKNKENDKVKREKLFSSERLPLAPLKIIDADLSVTVESLTTHLIQLEDMAANLTLDDGLLSLKPIKAHVGHGSFGGTVTIDARNTPAAIAADVELSDATYRNFGGKINFMADLNGSGDSIAAVMAGLDGYLTLKVREATLKKSFMTRFGSSLLESLNPFSKNEETSELVCAIILFDIEDGIANAHRKIAAQMTDVTWFGSGEINLKTEEIDFGISPHARKRLGISLGRLAKLVAVGGTLANPRIKFDPLGAATKYGKLSSVVATGGLSVVEDLLFSRIKANTDVCAKILEKLNADEESGKIKSK